MIRWTVAGSPGRPRELGGDVLGEALAAALTMVGDSEAGQVYLARCAGWTGPLPAADDRASGGLPRILDAMWRARTRAERRRLGQVFTPPPVARQVLLELGYPRSGVVLDPACGGGVFLAEAAQLQIVHHRACGLAPLEIAHRVLATVRGVDIDPVTARVARVVLGHAALTALTDLDDAATLPLPNVLLGDATHTGVLTPLPPDSVVVGNPPYREAKGMPRDERNALRERFGSRLSGAFDLYLAFLWLSLDLVGDTGRVGFVLPNKFLVAKYAASLRSELTATRRLHGLVDLSELDVFGRVGVYPVIVTLGPPQPHFKTVFRVTSREVLGKQPLPGAMLPQELPRQVSEPPVWFTLPDGLLRGWVERMASEHQPLCTQATARSTCSFHAKGLREQYVGDGEGFEAGLPYLGGSSYARRNEVRPYAVDWLGSRIRYDAEEFKAIGNPLPPLTRFQQPKAILCQHALRGTAYFDVDGRYITKDVYPIVTCEVSEHTAALVAVLNARAFSVLYALLFRGIAISGGYLHFLPVFLHMTPIPSLSGLANLKELVLRLQQSPTQAAVAEIDEVVGAAFGWTAPERQAILDYADAHLGYAPDPLA